MNETELSAQNKMGTMPIGKLLATMAVPMIISMLVQALYNVVDSIFVAKISEDALTAVSMAYPMQNLMIGLGTGTGVGVNALLSKSLGEKRYDKANRVASVSLFLAICNWIVFLLLGIFAVETFFRAQTDIESIVDYGTTYLRICCLVSFGLYGQICFERLLQSTGRTFYTMCSQGVGAIVNIILDPILIFGLLGMPKMGVAGAAWATVIGQITSMLLGLYLNLRKNHDIKLNLKQAIPDRHILAQIYTVAIPSILMVSIGSIMTFLMNKILIVFSSTAVAVFGIYFKLQSFIFMPIFGLNNGMVPIVAFNYGARKKDRIVGTMKLSVLAACAIMMIGLAAFQFAPEWLLLLFDASDNMLSIGVPALRTISLSFIFASFNIVTGSVFQALGDAFYSLLVSILRQLVVLLPSAYLLSLTGVLANVWYCFPIAEIFSTILTIILLRKVLRKLDF